MVAEALLRTLLPADVMLPIVVVKSARVTLPGSSNELILREGSKLELPLEEAVPLIKRGLLALDETRLYTTQELNKIRWLESRDINTIQKLEEDFYLKARLALTNWERSETDERKVASLKATLVDIVRLRMQKIMKAVAISPEPSREFLEKLTWEERIFYTIMCKMAKEWYKSMIEFIEKGDIIG